MIMDKFLLRFLLVVFFLVPWAINAQSLPFEETFDGTSAPSGWTMYTGLAENVFSGTATPTSATYGWSFGANNGLN